MNTSKINNISLETFVNNLKNYRRKEVVLTDFPVFTRDNVIYDEYVLKVGPKGGIKVHYDNNNKTLRVPSSRFVEAFEAGIGIVIQPSYRWGNTSTIFPTAKELPKFIKTT